MLQRQGKSEQTRYTTIIHQSTKQMIECIFSIIEISKRNAKWNDEFSRYFYEFFLASCSSCFNNNLIIINCNMISWSYIFQIFPKTFDLSNIHYITIFLFVLKLKRMTWICTWIYLLVTCPMNSTLFIKPMLILKLLWNKHLSINICIKYT